jgi:toxin-antitoxin system PIN domain toxin
LILLDANVLVYAVDRDSARHDAARRWLEASITSTEPVGLSWVTLLAFLRVTTRPGILVRHLAVDEALELVDRWLEVTVQVDPGPRHWSILRRLLAESGMAGNLSSDAHLAALALEHGATVATFDRDFRRFDGVRVVLPAE